MACLPVCITQHIMSIFQQKIIRLAKRKEKTQSKEKTSSRTRLRYDTDMRIAGGQPQLIQGIRRRDGLGDYLYAHQRYLE